MANNTLKYHNLFSSTLGKLKGEYSIYVIGKIIALIFSFALLPVLTRLLPKEDFGIVGLLWLIIPISRRIIDLGSDVSVTLRYFKLSKNELSNWIFHAISIYVVNLSFGILFERVGLFTGINVESRDILLILLIAFLQSFNSFQAALCKMEMKALNFILINILPQILGSSFTVFLVVFVKSDYSSYLYGILIGNLLVFIWSAYLLLSKNKISFYSPSKEIYFSIFRIGLPVVPGTLSVIILSSGDRYVIERLIGLEMVAVYTLGYRMAEYFLITFLEPLQNTLTPKIMSLAQESIEKVTTFCENKLYEILLIIILAISLLLWPQKWIIGLIGGSEYISAYPVYLFILGGIFLSNFTSLLTILFNHFEKTYQSMLVNVLLSIMNLLMNFQLIPIFGIYGACISTVFTFALQQPLLIFLLNKQLPKPLKIKRIIVAELIGFVFIGIFFYLEFIETVIPLSMIAIKIGVSVIFFILVLILKPSILNKIRTVL